MPKILIADDIQENRFVLKYFFKLFGDSVDFDVFEAETSKEAFSIINKELPDLVLLDIKLETNYAGLELINQLREIPNLSETKVWAVTAQTDLKTSEGGSLLEKFDDYIAKPYDPTILLFKISNLFDIVIPEKVKQKIMLK